MKITRRFTTAGSSPYATIEFRRATSEIKNPDGSVVFRLENHFAQPWLMGYRPNRFDTFWQFLDIDLAKLPASRKAQ